MLDEFSNDEPQGTIYESFSDVALCTLAVALLLVTLLAINITQNINVRVNRSSFSGGVTRPALHLECTAPDFARTTSADWADERALYGGQPYVAVHLFSPSLALITTDVRDGGTVALEQNETFVQQHDVSLHQFLELAAGIEPGSFEAEGRETALLLPYLVDKQMVYEPALERGYRVNADPKLARRMLATVWPVYANPLYPTRDPSEYSEARTRIYVETAVKQTEVGEAHYVIIGHASYRVPDAIEDGSLAWLAGFSSGLTEIRFLGELDADPAGRTNKRIRFFEDEDFEACAEAYRSYVYPSAPESDPRFARFRLQLEQGGLSEAQAVSAARRALRQVRVSRELLGGTLTENRAGVFPPLLLYTDAWSAYVEHYSATQPDPPKWFYRDFLDRLGFDRLTIEGVR